MGLDEVRKDCRTIRAQLKEVGRAERATSIKSVNGEAGYQL